MKQLAFQLGRQQVFLDLDGEDVEDQDDLVEIMANAHLNANFLALAREVSSAMIDLCHLQLIIVGHYGAQITRGHLQNTFREYK